MRAKIALENGAVFEGRSFGVDGEAVGEVVFNTCLSGYQEILTDPSYRGQIVTMTNPLIGNYGVNPFDVESEHPQVSALVVKEYFEYYSNWRGSESLGAWLKRHNIMAIEGVDTRMLTRMLRSVGAMRGVISTIDADDSLLIEKARNAAKMEGLDLAREVTCPAPYDWQGDEQGPYILRSAKTPSPRKERRYRVVVYDYGVKLNILRRLACYGCDLKVVPADYSAKEVLSMKPDGIFLSNGPGDPAAVKYAIENIKRLLGRVPIFGICLGHQLLALALGGKTFKLKFGHRGGNHPVKNLLTTAIEITSQNHGFAVDPASLDGSTIEITHVNLNDGTNEGLSHRQMPLFSVQYHPEASPGPHDSDYLFRDFILSMEQPADSAFSHV